MGFTVTTIVSDDTTGEVTQESVSSCEVSNPNIVIDAETDAARKANARKRRASLQSLMREYGYFSQVRYRILVPFCPELSNNDLSRLLLMAAIKNSHAKFDCRDLAVDRGVAAKTFKRLEEAGYLFGGRDPECIPDSFACMGKLDRKQVYQMSKSGEYVTRLYCTPYQSIYYSTPPRSHGALGSLFRLLPWMNRQYNVICDNPGDWSFSRMTPLNRADISELTGKPRRKASDLFRSWDALDFAWGTKHLPIIKKIDVGGRTGYAINPRLVYGGSHIREAEEIFLAGGATGGAV